jgi:hypothetical protein
MGFVLFNFPIHARISLASRGESPLRRYQGFSKQRRRVAQASWRARLRMDVDSPLRMEDVCFVGRKRDPKTGNISGRVFVVKDNIDTDVSLGAEMF